VVGAGRVSFGVHSGSPRRWPESSLGVDGLIADQIEGPIAGQISGQISGRMDGPIEGHRA
jgi:hypothetical protein